VQPRPRPERLRALERAADLLAQVDRARERRLRGAEVSGVGIGVREQAAEAQLVDDVPFVCGPRAVAVEHGDRRRVFGRARVRATEDLGELRIRVLELRIELACALERVDCRRRVAAVQVDLPEERARSRTVGVRARVVERGVRKRERHVDVVHAQRDTRLGHARRPVAGAVLPV